ncbi:hypothetical protein SEA_IWOKEUPLIKEDIS_65 [Mycobacterium phage Iwokeuplikedis]|nr:hypothetical protein SEA_IWOKEUPLIKEDIS_65 [Mycobacterium phage Iwokeuplikedis]
MGFVVGYSIVAGLMVWMVLVGEAREAREERERGQAEESGSSET